MSYYGVNRYICTVLNEIRKCHETRNYSILLSLVEEAQVLANRMEAGLEDKQDLKLLAEDRSKAKKEVYSLQEEIKKLESKRDKLKPKKKSKS